MPSSIIKRGTDHWSAITKYLLECDNALPANNVNNDHILAWGQMCGLPIKEKDLNPLHRGTLY